MKKKIETSTAKLYDLIHRRQTDKKIFKRITNNLNLKYLGLKKNFFNSKICLDAASGLNANATVDLLNLGAKHVHLFDINKNILSFTKKFLIKKFPEKRFTIKVGNLLKIKYPRNYFDFVHCSGAIHHTVNYKKSINELCRVTKKGGLLYLHFYGRGGIVQDIVEFLRGKYANNPNFKKMVKSLDKKTFFKIISFIKKENQINKVNKFTNSEYLGFLKYFDYDVILTLKDRIQSPLYKQIEYKDVVKILKKNNFYKIKRLTKFPYYSNYRKFLSPFYKNYDNYYSKILYGDGMPQILCKKK